MKKLLPILIAILMIIPAKAQVIVDDVNINELDITVCEMVAYVKFMSMKSKVNLIIDYGQENGQYSGVTGPDGKPVTFNGAIDGINFMEKNGWKLDRVFSQAESGGSSTHYLFRRANTVPKE